jgi:hypothetical protein
MKLKRTIETMGSLDRQTEVVHIDDHEGDAGPQTIVLHQYCGSTALFVEHGTINIDDAYVPDLIAMLRRSVKRRADEAQRRIAQAKHDKQEAKRLAKRAGQPK